MDREINLMLSYGALGLAGYIVFKLLTRTEIQCVEYRPDIGYADDKNNNGMSFGGPAEGKDTLIRTSDGGKIYQTGVNTYQYVN